MFSAKSLSCSWIPRGLSIALVLCLLCSSTPAAPQTIVALAKESTFSFLFWYHSNGIHKLIQGQGPGNGHGQEKQSDRDAKVTRLQVFPSDAAVDISDHIRFSAVAFDRDDNTVGGVKIKWSGKSSAPGGHAHISEHGEFEATAPGSFSIEAEAQGKKAQVTVTVRPGVRRDLNSPATGPSYQVSSRDLPSRKVGTTKGRDQPASTKRLKRASIASSRQAHSVNEKAILPEPMPQGGGDGWNDQNYWSADEPGNEVGNPPGASQDGGAGSGNFQFAAPIYSAPGRGINISLGAAYNSRLWNKADTQISYDNDRGWPAPGFSLGFGKLLGMGVYHGGMLIDADGTRHAYQVSITPIQNGSKGISHTIDGSLIDYWYVTGIGGGITSAQAQLPNGTIIHYGAPGPGAVYPTWIKDANGNFITITYVNNSGPRLQTVTDTLGRTILFYYDSNNLLTAITAPGLNNGPGSNNITCTLVRFHYHQLSLGYSFNGLTASARDPYPWVVDAIYYPATSTGYWLNDSDSYSSYGMLAKVVEERAMGFLASSLNDMGSVSEGSRTRLETYNYPLNANSSLTDAPTYTSMTESWSRDGTNFDSATTAYDVHENDTPRTVTVTLPNGTKSTQYSYNYSSLPDTNPLKALDGLVYHDETYVTSSNILQSSTSSWEQGDYGSPRPTQVQATNEIGQSTTTTFSYDGSGCGQIGHYNQVFDVRNLGYNGELLRSTRTCYQNNDSYTGHPTSYEYVGRHIFNLPLNVELYAGDNVTRVSRTEYQYDVPGLSDAPGVVMHDETYNPYTTETSEYCCDWEWDPVTSSQYCAQWCPQSVFDPSTSYRGNVTQVTSYADATSLTGPVTETRAYDITGNVVTASTSCCEQTTFSYTDNTQYAYPESKTRGSASDPYAQVTTSGTYDFNTGLGLSATDANGKQSTTSYDANTLRVVSAVSSTTAHTDYAYDDAAMTVISKTYLTPGVNGVIADQNTKYLNGRGQVRQEAALGAGGVWDFVDALYDNMGQVSQQTQPYRSGQAQPSTTITYDALGRVNRVTAPDGSVTETYYNEKDFDTTDGYTPTRPNVDSGQGETTLVRDAWGRERWGRTDAQGRLVAVVEPDPSGGGSVASNGLVTTYSYNTLGNLTQANQGSQTRSFKYDSLGRLTAQKLAEQSATLNDAGTYVGSGTWSDLFTYDERSNLTSRTDARGVRTVYTYNSDPLNRLQSVSWDTTGFGDTTNPILSAATVTYQYRTKTSSSDLKDVTQLSSVTTSSVSTETYGYDDGEGRVTSKTLTVNNRPSFVTDYIYDSLDRVKDVRYPAEFGNGSQPRKIAHHDYDIASRISGLTYDGQSFASNIAYNAASQTTSLTVGTGTNQIAENYSYNAQTGLLDNQTVARGGTTLLNLSYDYANSSGKRTGQLTKILNNLNHDKDRSYAYDALGRLKVAQGGLNGSLWTQTYSYDRYGNRTSVSASGYSAKNESRGTGSAGVSPALSARSVPRAVATGLSDKLKFVEPSDLRVELPTEQLARSNSVELRNNDKPVSDAPPTLRAPSLPQSGPPTFTNDPLNDPQNPESFKIKALHITELRTWINALRVRRGLSNYSWQQPTATGGVVQPGGLITADPIVEMRLALDEALGPPPAPGYSSGLAHGELVLAVHIQELRDRVKAAWNSSSSIPRDGLGSLSYDPSSNRITTGGFAYDAAGNQTRALIPGSTASQRFQYDAANRLVKVKGDDNTTVLATYTYGDSNERLIADEGGQRTYYVGEGGSTIAEYTESGGSTNPAWFKSYVYLGARLLSTLTPNGSGGEAIQFHHPDRLGTRLVTDPVAGTSFEQVTLPFGTALGAESTGETNRRFTSYDRSATTKLDYAGNRHYDPQQGRFTQVDPIGLKSVGLSSPQTLNLYAYCTNDPINHTDPSGLGFFSFFKKVVQGIGKILTNKWVLLIAGIALGALSGLGFYFAFSLAPVGATVNTAFLVAAIGLAGMSALLIVGATHQNFLRVVKTIGGIASTVQGIAGLINGTINGGMLGTPPWNPNAGSGVGPVFNFTNNSDESWANRIVARGVEAALQVLAKGCWNSSVWNRNVRPGNRYFANVQNPDKYTSGWKDSGSVHSNGAKESRSIIRVTVSGGRAAPVLTSIVGFSYVLKYYPGEGMTVTTNTESLRHWASTPGYVTGLDPNVNVRIAKEFIELAPKCK